MHLVTLSRPMQVSSPAEGGEQESRAFTSLWDLTHPLSHLLVTIVWEVAQADANAPKIPRRDSCGLQKGLHLTGGLEDG